MKWKMGVLQACALHIPVPIQGHVDYIVETFIHTPNTIFKGVMRILEFANIVEVAK